MASPTNKNALSPNFCGKVEMYIGWYWRTQELKLRATSLPFLIHPSSPPFPFLSPLRLYSCLISFPPVLYLFPLPLPCFFLSFLLVYLRGPGKRCKLPRRSWGGATVANTFLTILTPENTSDDNKFSLIILHVNISVTQFKALLARDSRKQRSILIVTG